MARKFSPIVALALIFAVFYSPDSFEPESIGGKRVLITGSSSGIGEELAYQYCKLGASVVITGEREGLLRKVASKCNELGAKKVEYVVVADMGRLEDRQKLVTATEKHLGGLDHLILNHDVINSGVWLGSSANQTDFRRKMDLCFFSHVDIASKFVRMLTASKGNIGVVSSLAGKVGMPYLSTQSACKFALQGFFSSFRQELRARETGVSLTICYIDYASTDAVAYFPTDSLLIQPSAVGDAATVILKGVTKGAYDVSYPRLASFFANVYKFIPGYAEDYYYSLISSQQQTKHEA